MDEKTLRSLSPLDGRYHEKTEVTREIFSELGLIKHRLKVEVEWLKYFLNNFSSYCVLLLKKVNIYLFDLFQISDCNV